MSTSVWSISRRSLSWLLRQPGRNHYRLEGSFDPSQARLEDGDAVDTVIGEQRDVLTPAQAAAFVTKSTSWRCISCGKVHAFEQPVRVGAASPCSCLQIEFETEGRIRPAGYSLQAITEV